jgi:hypothetical protein
VSNVLFDGNVCFPFDLVRGDILSNADGHASTDDRPSVRSTRITIVRFGLGELHHESARSDPGADSLRNDH